MTALATIKNWFLTGLKPTQSQFHAWMDSFWHKSDMIPTNKIEGLEGILNDKASNAQLIDKVDKAANKSLLLDSEILRLAGMASDADAPVSNLQLSADALVLANAKTYADGLVVGLLDDRGNYNASTNLFPASGGSGISGAVLKGDLWSVSVAGTLGGVAVTSGDVVRALVNAPGQTNTNWVITENNFGYVAENSANKSNSVGDINSTTLFPTWNAARLWVISLGYQTLANVNALLATFKTANFLDATSSVQTQINARQLNLGFLPDNPNIKNETLVTVGGARNNQATPTNFLRFNNTITPTIISGFANPVDGKVIRLFNNTANNISLLHNSAASTDINRLNNINSQDLIIVIGGVAEYIYSSVLGRWLLVNIWGTDYFASLVSPGEGIVGVSPLGMASKKQIIEFVISDDARTTPYTVAELNATYGTLTKHQRLDCRNIVGGGITYIKHDGLEWNSSPLNKMT